jgi:hypothetical protein
MVEFLPNHGVFGKRVEGRTPPETNRWHINGKAPQDADLTS